MTRVKIEMQNRVGRQKLTFLGLAAYRGGGAKVKHSETLFLHSQFNLSLL